jgi:glycosyltransferase involved in cell wall biosynthesis
MSTSPLAPTRHDPTSSVLPKVSVIIPTYNCESFIEQTIASVRAQTFQDFELIVIDDGSTDSTPAILKRHLPSIRVIRTANGGVCKARNLGICEAMGQFICLLDHDDHWYPDKLETQIRAFNEHPEVDIVFTEFVNWVPGPDGFPSPDSFDRDAGPEDADPDFSGWIYHQFLLDCWMLTSTAMFKASVFQDCGTFDEDLPYSEDWDLWIRIARRHQFLKLKRPSTLYRQHPGQGNRVVRQIDYRTRLLEESVERWGLCSPDGRCVPRRAFQRELSRYHFEYGLMHVSAGNRAQALQALWQAFRAHPRQFKMPLYMIATAFGWKPRWART